MAALPQRAASALGGGRYGVVLEVADACMRERAKAAGWRPIRATRG